MARRSWWRLTVRLTLTGVLHPTTAAALIAVAWRFRARGWFRRFPFLPLPDGQYVRWRMYTAYGDSALVPAAEDVIRYARWAVRD
jgi:hypothetical protein